MSRARSDPPLSLPARVIHADDENPGAVRRITDALHVGDNRRTGNDRDAGKTGARHPLDGSWADGGQIDPTILTGLRRLDEHATGCGELAAGAQVRNTAEHPVGSLRGFDGDNMAIGDD